MSTKTILITGASGYIGRHVVARLNEMGVYTVALDRTADSNASRSLSCDIFDLDVSDLLGSLDVFPDACLHLAWRNGFEHNNPSHIEDLSKHFSFLTNLATAGVEQIAVMGSMHEIGYWEGAVTEETPCNPRSLYGVAKNTLREALSLAFARENSPVFQWIRGFYVYGDDERAQSIFGKILRAARRGDKTFPFTTGANEYDFLSLEELSTQIALVVMQREIAGVINCCSGTPVSLAECIEEFILENGLDITLEYGAFPDRPYDSPAIWGDNSKIKQIIGCSNIEEGSSSMLGGGR